MKRPPCIRGLAAFKKGCPQRSWNGTDGCSAWIEKRMSTKGGQEFVEIKECLDHYMARLQFDTNRLLEGNQQAVESFRNNVSVDGAPKPDPALVRLVQIAEENRLVRQIEG